LPSFSHIATVGNWDNASGTTLDTSGSLNVAAHDLLVAVSKWESGDTTTSVQKNSGSPANVFDFPNISPDTHFYSAFGGEFGYVLDAAADATATFRQTMAAARDGRRFFVMQFRPTSGYVAVYDAAHCARGTSAAPNSGNISTTGNDAVAIGAYGEFSSNTTSSEQINGVAATEPTNSPQDQASVWYRILTSTFTNGAASATLANIDWWCGISAFKLASTAAPDPVGFWPPDNGTDVGPGVDLILFFAGQMQSSGSRNIVLKDDTLGTTVQPIASNSGSVTYGADGSVRIVLASPLVMGHSYHVEVDADAMQLVSNSSNWAGISNSTTWNFTALFQTSAPRGWWG